MGLRRCSAKIGRGDIYKAEWFACVAHGFNLMHTNMIDKNKDPKIYCIQSNLTLVKNIHSQKNRNSS